MRRWFAFVTMLVMQSAQADSLTLHPVKIAPDVYAVIGDLGGQTYENEGLNNNLGFIVGVNNVLVINSGPSTRVARALHDAIKKVTSKPVKWLVNLNSQNHNWLGNGYFVKQGVTLIASTETARMMNEVGAQQLQSNSALLKEKFSGTKAAGPAQTFERQFTIDLGTHSVQILFVGPAHTPGDSVVWMPHEKIIFAGDVVFTERMLGIFPIGSSAGWVKAFDQIAALQPQTIIPGHGHPTNLMRARADTRDYLVYLRTEVAKLRDKGASLQDAVEGVDQSQYKHLANFDLLARRNVNQTYLDLEQESF